MWGNVLRSVLLCGVLATGTPAVPADVIDPYTPVTPRESSLAGSEVSSGCREGAPVIDYSVTVTDPTAPDPAAPASATLTMSNAASSLDVPLGMVRDGRLEGSVPWPAPSWTHDGVATVLRVGGLTLSVPLDRPMTAEDCGTGVPASGGSTGSTGSAESTGSAGSAASALAGTGAETPLIVGAVAASALLAGGVLFGLGRRRARRTAVR
jgi:hypothetical protein